MDKAVNLQEGQIYEGSISLTGHEGQTRRWIVVAPFGKTHIHAIDNPTDLRCWPAALVEAGVRSGKLNLVETNPQHPVLALQRDKEAHNLQDLHLGFHGDALEKMLALLQEAATADKAYTPYAAGEILEFLKRTALRPERRKRFKDKVQKIIMNWFSLNQNAACSNFFLP